MAFVDWDSAGETRLEKIIKNINYEMDYSDLIEEMEQYTEAVLTRLDQEIYEEKWEFYAITETDEEFKEQLGKGDDPIEAFKNARD